jgi:hypothetical protein
VAPIGKKLASLILPRLDAPTRQPNQVGRQVLPSLKCQQRSKQAIDKLLASDVPKPSLRKGTQRILHILADESEWHTPLIAHAAYADEGYEAGYTLLITGAWCAPQTTES